MARLKQLGKDFLLKTFDIREGELERVLLIQLNIFLIIFTLLVIKPVVNAQFISVIGIEQLPLVFVLVAICAILVSTIYSRALTSKSLKRVIKSTLIISVLSLVGIALLLQLNIGERLVLYVLYVGVAIFGVLTTSQFWIMANLAFDAREAKRLFSFIGAGPIAGGVAGGYLTSLLANYIDGVNLLYVGAALLCLCIPVNDIIWKRYIVTLNTFQKKKRFTDFGNHPFWLIWKSKHLTYLALLIGLSVIVSKLVEYQFSSVAAAAYPDPDDLTSFFGFWFSTFNVVSLLIQLFITRKIVGTFGVGMSLFALPGGIIFGSVLLLFAPVLWAGIFTKLWEVSMKQSVNKSATELLALPIPATIKNQTKSFIDIFVDLAATGLAGLLLIFIVNGLDLSIQAISVLTLVIVAIWFWVAIGVRKEYLNSFKSKLTQADKEAKRELPDFNDISVLNGLRRALKQGNEDQIVFVLDKVREITDDRLFDDVIRFLDHDSPKVRFRALECIYFLNKSVDADRLSALIVDEDQEVRYSAFRQLIRQNPGSRISLFKKHLESDDPKVSGAALVGLAQEARSNPEMKKRFDLENRIQEKIDYLQLSLTSEDRYLYEVMILRAIGHSQSSNFYGLIFNYLKSEDPRLVVEAIHSAGYTMSPDFVEVLVSHLPSKSTRIHAQNALLNFGAGIANELLAQSKRPDIKTEISYQLPAVLERLDARESVQVLISLLETGDVNMRLEALRSLNAIQRDFPHLKISKEDVVSYILEETKTYKGILAVFYKQSELIPTEQSQEVTDARKHLMDLLERRLDGTLERIFRLIGLRYPPEDVITVYQGIRSVNKSTRLNSVEFLDNLLEPSLKKTLVPIAESAIFDSLTKESVESLNIKIPDEHRCFSLLLEGKDIRVKMAVFKLISVLGDKEYHDLVSGFVDSPNEKIRTIAREVAAKLS